MVDSLAGKRVICAANRYGIRGQFGRCVVDLRPVILGVATSARGCGQRMASTTIASAAKAQGIALSFAPQGALVVTATTRHCYNKQNADQKTIEPLTSPYVAQ